MAEKKAEKTPEPKKKVAAKLFEDVKRPEDIPASATSKPVIVGHTNIIKDPMVAPEVSKVEETKVETQMEKPKHELKLQPLTEASKEELVAEAEDSTKAETVETTLNSEATEQSPPETQNETNEEAQPQSTEEQTPQEVSDDDSPINEEGSTSAVDVIAEGINTKKERDEEVEKQQVVDNEINELVNSKQYNVKIRPAPNKRKARMLIGLIILGVLAGLGWYFGVGPGRDMWLDKKTTTKTADVVEQQAQSTTKATEATPQTLAFTNSTIKTTFSYPKAWKVDVAKSTEFPTVDVITLTGSNEEVDSVTDSSPAVKVGSFMRVKIFVENTKDTKEYASDLKNSGVCTSEDIIAGNTNLKLLFTGGSKGQNISKVTLSPEACLPTGTLFSGNDQVQLTTKQNTYVIYAEHIFSNEYLEKNGTKTEEAVKLAQESGIVTSKDSFKSTKSYTEFLEVLKSLKEL